MTSGGVQPEERPVAVVTGASGGIGRAVVDKLIADGMRVAAVDMPRCAALVRRGLYLHM